MRNHTNSGANAGRIMKPQNAFMRKHKVETSGV